MSIIVKDVEKTTCVTGEVARRVGATAAKVAFDKRCIVIKMKRLLDQLRTCAHECGQAEIITKLHVFGLQVIGILIYNIICIIIMST